jgi:hypothetical protein
MRAEICLPARPSRRGGYRSPEPAVPWNWKQTISSALLYTLAFNLTFFI